jgi:LTXXQ motif family protein
MERNVKVRLVIILAIASLAYSGRSYANTRQPSDVKARPQADSVAPTLERIPEGADADSGPSPDGETVIVNLPFPSLEIDSSIAEYLNLDPAQVEAIQHLVEQEHQELEPLMAELQSTHEKLLAATAQGHAQETEALAAAEARLLTELIIKSTRTEVSLHGLLTEEQQKKLEDLNRSKQP